MTDKINIEHHEMLGQMLIAKPKKNAKIGIPYKPYHHIAIIDDYVLLYVWNTREIQDAFRLADLQSSFETTQINDNFRELHIGPTTTKRAMRAVQSIKSSRPYVPIYDSTNLKMQDIKLVTSYLYKQVYKFAEKHDYIIGDGVRVLALPAGMQAKQDRIGMFERMQGRYVNKELHIGRRQQYFEQAKLLMILQIIHLHSGVSLADLKTADDILNEDTQT